MKLVACSIDGTLILIEYNEQTKTFKTTPFTAHPAGVTAVEVVEMNEKVYIISGGIDCLVKVYENDGKNWNSKIEMKEHNEWIRDIAVNMIHGYIYIVSCDISTVVISKCDGVSCELVQKIEGFNASVERVHLNGDNCLIVLSDGAVESWKFSNDRFVKEE